MLRENRDEANKLTAEQIQRVGDILVSTEIIWGLTEAIFVKPASEYFDFQLATFNFLQII